MKDRAGLERMTREQDRRISDVVLREQSRLRRFIRGRVPSRLRDRWSARSTASGSPEP
jgi:hypothetical protein